MASILLIEDDTQHLELLSEILEFGGHNTYMAKNTDIAKNIIDENKIDFIVTDIYLPGMSGLEFIENLQNQGKNIPFVVVTGSLEEQDKQKAKELNALSYILKPIDPEQFLDSFNKNAKIIND